MRECGDCTFCCEAIGDMISPCPRIATGGGCMIYEIRPRACRDWSCAWRDGKIAEHLRPKDVGFAISFDKNGDAKMHLKGSETRLGKPVVLAAFQSLLQSGRRVILAPSRGAFSWHWITDGEHKMRKSAPFA